MDRHDVTLNMAQDKRKAKIGNDMADGDGDDDGDGDLGDLGVLDLVGTNAVVAGLELASSVVFTFVPPLLLKLGFGESQMSVILGIGPFIALLTVPTLGKWSDRCQSAYGRRKPFILVYSVILIASLIVLIFAQNIIYQPKTKYIGMCLIAVSVIALDYASQAAINPCESLMADLMDQSGQSGQSDADKGYRVYSGMLSLGACLGYLISAIDWRHTARLMGSEEQSALLSVLVLFLLALALTLSVVRERPLRTNQRLLSTPTVEDNMETELLQPLNGHPSAMVASEEEDEAEDERVRCCGPRGGGGVAATMNGAWHKQHTPLLLNHYFTCAVFRNGVPSFLAGTHLLCRYCWCCCCWWWGRLQRRLHRGLHLCQRQSQHQSLKWSHQEAAWADFCRRVCKCLASQLLRLPLSVLHSIHTAPLVLKRLFWADLLSWMAVMAHAMFCTDFVATVVYQGKPDAEKGHWEDQQFDDGVRMGSWGLLLHSITAGLFALFAQKSLVQRFGLRATYTFGLFTFAVSMLFTAIFPNVIVLNVCATVSGIGFAVITTVPNTLITLYHAKPDVFLADRRRTGANANANANAGYGQDLAVLDAGYYLSQIILSAFMGQIVETTGLPQLYIAVAALCGFVSAGLATRVAFVEKDVTEGREKHYVVTK